LQDAVEGDSYSDETDHSNSEFCESEVVKQRGVFFQPDMCRLANTRIYFVLLRGLVAVTRQDLQLIVALRNKVETFFVWKKIHRAPAVLKIQAPIKTGLCFIYICQHQDTKFSAKGRDQTAICPTQKLTAFKGKLQL